MGNALSCIESHHDDWDGHPEVQQDYPPIQTTIGDMTQPLSSYFISSGHNSYLTSDQLMGKSGTSTIAMCLKAGCRVVELDVYNQQSGFDGPVCKHGGTLTAPVAFKECVEAVAEYAFTNSPFPVIITLENHTDEPNQSKMAEILQSVLGTMLYVPVPGEEDKPWQSPEQLTNKVLIRANASKAAPELKRLVYIINTKFASLQAANQQTKRTSSSFDEAKARKLLKKALEASGLSAPRAEDSGSKRRTSSGGAGSGKMPAKAGQKLDDMTAKEGVKVQAAANVAMNEAPADDVPEEALNTVHSLSELYAYTSKHLMRVYPGGMRVDSSNQDPTVAWSAGASLAALNWQNWDKGLWLNAAMFAQNGACGYVLKPQWMRACHPGMPPSSPLPARSPGTLSLHVHSAYVQQHGNMMCWKDDVYVQMDLEGMPMDCQTQCTKATSNTGRLKVNKTYQFSVTYPEMAILLVRIRDQDFQKGGSLDDELGHWQVPLSLLQPGEYKLQLEKKQKLRADRWVKVRIEWVPAPAEPNPAAGNQVRAAEALNPARQEDAPPGPANSNGAAPSPVNGVPAAAPPVGGAFVGGAAGMPSAIPTAPTVAGVAGGGVAPAAPAAVGGGMAGGVNPLAAGDLTSGAAAADGRVSAGGGVRGSRQRM